MTKKRRDCYWHSNCEPDYDLGYCDLHDKVLGKDGFWCTDCSDVKIFRDGEWVKEKQSGGI